MFSATKPQTSRKAVFHIAMILIKVTVVQVGRDSEYLSQKRRRINERMPEPNDNFSMTMGNKVIVDAVFRDTGLDCFLDGLKRNQGESVSNEIKALVVNSAL